MAGDRQTVPAAALVQALVFVLFVPFLPLVLSGRWSWWQAWAFALVSVLGFAISRRLAARRNPGIIAERAHFLRHEDVQHWDRVLARVVGLGGAAIPLVAGFDARYAWSADVPTPATVAALIVFIGAYIFSSAALVANPFFSGEVRIQRERGHAVIASGPYRWIRHPGYAGAIVAYAASPVLLGSWWTCLPAAALSVVLVVRTALEDAYLRRELNGYGEYADRVRFRLVPGIW